MTRAEVSPARQFDLVFLDMDGTLVDERSAWEWVHHHFGVSNVKNAERYLRHEIDDLEFMRSDIRLWQVKNGGAVHIDEVRKALDRAPLMPGARDLVAALKEAGTRTVIMTGGIDILAERVARETGIDAYVANRLVADDDGWIVDAGDVVVPIRDKATPTRHHRQAHGFPKSRCAAVGNSRYDLPMFAETAKGVAFFPVDDDVRAGADVVIEEKDLRLVVPALVGPS